MNLAEGTMALVIRTSADPVGNDVVGAQRASDAGSQPAGFQRTDHAGTGDGSVAQPRFRTFLISMFAALALVLAALGLYGVVAYSVSQRTTELGIRMALGAQPGSILKLVVFRAAGLAAIGLGIGIAGSLAGSRMVSRVSVWRKRQPIR